VLGFRFRRDSLVQHTPRRPLRSWAGVTTIIMMIGALRLPADAGSHYRLTACGSRSIPRAFLKQTRRGKNSQRNPAEKNFPLDVALPIQGDLGLLQSDDNKARGCS